MSVCDLINDELQGKADAIARYDEMLWKIRSGYALFLYASVGVIAGLVNEKSIVLSATTVIALSMLIVGFSVFAMFLDYSFMRSKLRVVTYRDRLIRLAYRQAVGAALREEDEEALLECLENSGERRERVDWKQWAGFWRPPILYGGTCVVCIAAATILAG